MHVSGADRAFDQAGGKDESVAVFTSDGGFASCQAGPCKVECALGCFQGVVRLYFQVCGGDSGVAGRHAGFPSLDDAFFNGNGRFDNIDRFGVNPFNLDIVAVVDPDGFVGPGKQNIRPVLADSDPVPRGNTG
jgi:hypothetical protein